MRLWHRRGYVDDAPEEVERKRLRMALALLGMSASIPVAVETGEASSVGSPPVVRATIDGRYLETEVVDGTESARLTVHIAVLTDRRRCHPQGGTVDR